MRKDNSIPALSMLTSLEECKGSNEEKFSLLLKALTQLRMEKIQKCELTHRFTKKHFANDLEAFGDLLMVHQDLFSRQTLPSVIKGYVFSLLTERWFVHRVVVDIEQARKLLELVLWLKQAFGPDEIGTYNRFLRDLGFSFNGLDASDMMTILEEIDAGDPANASAIAEGWIKSQGSLNVAMQYLQMLSDSQNEPKNIEEMKGVLAELLKTYPPQKSEWGLIAQRVRYLFEHGPNDAMHFLFENANPHYRLGELLKTKSNEKSLEQVQEELKPYGDIPPDGLDNSQRAKRDRLQWELIRLMGQVEAQQWCVRNLGYWVQPPESSTD